MTSSRAAGVFNSLYFPFGFMKTTQCFYTFPGWEFGGCPEENGGRMDDGDRKCLCTCTDFVVLTTWLLILQINERNSGWDDLIFIPPGKSLNQHINEVSA